VTATTDATVQSDDDLFHAPTNDDPMWTETCWFAFFVPERSLSGTLYPLFRKNLGVCSAAVHIWDASGREPYRARYSKNLWHLPFPDTDLTDVSLPGGLAYRRIEPATRFAMTYADGDAIRLDLEFEGVVPPHYLGSHHLDQPGRVTGTLHLDGEDIAVDCFAMRDRSWGLRDDIAGGLGSPSGHGGYSYAMTTPGEGWHAISAETDGDTCAVRAGYIIKDGELSDVVSGERRVLERDNDFQTRVAISLEDKLGRTVEAEGTCRNGFAWQFTPNMFSLISLTEWSWDGNTGWGEDHDNWTVSGWQARVRAAR
jgi:hypothetical protein